MTTLKFLPILFLPFAAVASAAPPEECVDCIIIADRVNESLITVTALGAETFTFRVGQAVTVLQDGDLDRLQSAPLTDILAQTPGVTITRNGGIGKTSQVRIRGAEGDQTLVLIDGIRVNDPSSPGGGFDFGNLLTDQIYRVEVLRGPNSVPWGSQAIGGVINIVTDHAANSFSGNARAEAGFKDNARLSGSLSGGSGKFSAKVGGGWFRDDGISTFKGGTERDGYRQYAANGKVRLEISDAVELSAGAFYADSKIALDGFPPPFFAFADTPEFQRTKELYSYARAQFNVKDGNYKNSIGFTLSDINRDNFDAPGQAVPSFLARGRTERFEYRGDWEFSNRYRAVFGAEHETSRFSDGFSLSKTQVTSGFAQLVSRPFDTDLNITIGGRVDNHQDYGTQATFSTNAAWAISGSDTVLRASYGEGFKAPTLFQLDSFFGNVALQPEQARSFDLGIEHAFGTSDIRAALTLFQRNTRNQIDFISCFGQSTGICTNRPFGTYDNVARTRARGAEFTLSTSPTDRLKTRLIYSFTDAEDRTTGLTLLRRPKHSATLSADWETPWKAKLGGSLRGLSKSADVDFQTFSRTRLKGHVLADVRATLPISERIELYGRVENLFDKNYALVSGYGTLGRNAHIGVRAKF